MKKYLTVGTDIIEDEKFREIHDSFLHGSIKPSGGLWLSDFDLNFTTYNCWVDFILSHSYILFYKNKSSDPFIQPCSIISLKEDASIFCLCKREDYQFLLEHYGVDKEKFSFEKLSCDYDGIYIDLNSLSKSLSIEEMNLFSSFGVNSCILFCPSCIDYYYSGRVLIDPFDYECGFNDGFIPYNIEWDSSIKKVNCGLKKKLSLRKD